jgi:hypothetical protein
MTVVIVVTGNSCGNIIITETIKVKGWRGESRKTEAFILLYVGYYYYYIFVVVVVVVVSASDIHWIRLCRPSLQGTSNRTHHGLHPPGTSVAV